MIKSDPDPAFARYHNRWFWFNFAIVVVDVVGAAFCYGAGLRDSSIWLIASSSLTFTGAFIHNYLSGYCNRRRHCGWHRLPRAN